MERDAAAIRWAIDLSLLLNARFGPERFPVDVPRLAVEYSRARYPAEPILKVLGAYLPGFDGALVRSQGARTGWGIVYKDAVSSRGRKNFTIAHEFGHYLLHRQGHPEGFRCSSDDVVRWDSEYGQVEHQANVFAANLLMPFDDYRHEVPHDRAVDFHRLTECAERYGVSLAAASLRWIGYTTRRAVLVCSRDGFILWARSSERALRTGRYFRTSSGPIEIPTSSLAASQDRSIDGKSGVRHGPGVWFPEAVQEMTVVSDQYDFALTLLCLDNQDARQCRDDPVDRLVGIHP